jgi:dTDP-4-dehydrorhamnose reductase
VRLLVLGSAGMLGRDLVRAAERAGHDVTGRPRAEVDITSAAAVGEAVADARPDVVANCAAFTNVDGAEVEQEDALHVNGDAAGTVASAAAEAGATVLYPSTDYVFDGTKREPYLESDPVDPRTSYGRSKLAGERATAASNPRHVIARTSWLFGTGGRNFVETMLALAAERDEVTVVSDQVGSPTFTGHLADGLLRLAAGERFGVHHLSAEGACSWYDFARAIFERAGLDCRVEPCTTEEAGRPAPRPAFSVLDTEWPEPVRLPRWEDGLDAYLAERVSAR